MSTKKVFCSAGFVNYASVIDNFEIVNSIKEADVVILEHGEHLSPETYNQKRNPYTGRNILRDKEDLSNLKEAILRNKKILGFGRGAHILCVHMGGSLAQVAIRRGEYDIKLSSTSLSSKDTLKSYDFQTQRMLPFKIPTEEYIILGESKCQGDYYGEDNSTKISFPLETEVIMFPRIKALGFQSILTELIIKNNCLRSNGEYKETIKKFKNLINKFIGK